MLESFLKLCYCCLFNSILIRRLRSRSWAWSRPWFRHTGASFSPWRLTALSYIFNQEVLADLAAWELLSHISWQFILDPSSTNFWNNVLREKTSYIIWPMKINKVKGEGSSFLPIHLISLDDELSEFHLSILNWGKWDDEVSSLSLPIWGKS